MLLCLVSSTVSLLEFTYDDNLDFVPIVLILDFLESISGLALFELCILVLSIEFIVYILIYSLLKLFKIYR